MNEKVKDGIIGTLFALVVLGGTLTLTGEEYDHAYICLSTEQIGVFTGNANTVNEVSATGRTGYWVDEFGNNRRSSCSDGWVKLSEYAKDVGLSKDEIVKNLNPKPIKTSVAGCYEGQKCEVCDALGCEAV